MQRRCTHMVHATIRLQKNVLPGIHVLSCSLSLSLSIYLYMPQALLPAGKLKKGTRKKLFDWASNLFAFNDEVCASRYSREGNDTFVYCRYTYHGHSGHIQRCHILCIHGTYVALHSTAKCLSL